ncbi:MAG: tryptophan--tRNA ligase [Alphaproteobacteria bacterium CG_4_10_14_0_8_um_filter_53_9]|nr:MAG: tryptophan--tRNA ligase [Alphaproteobacteria bacterium CG_4_10_14_0_8_um_filter_53_9]
MDKIIFSGVQPSGTPSLGNYLGAFKQFPKFEEAHKVYLCVVDEHAITVRQKPEDLHHNTLAIAAWYLASGINPNVSTIFIQSHVPAHTQLGWMLSTLTYMGELERMTQYKDKSQKKAENLNAGLFTYPALMAADILLYDTHAVPVGEDQKQHLELARNLAIRFNNAFGDTFVVPEFMAPPAGARVRDLQNPEKKMSKSEPGPGTILLTDTPQEAAKKIKRAQTDNEARIVYDPENQAGISNLLEILAACTNRTPQQAVMEFEGQQYGALKAAVAESVVFALEDIQAKYKSYMDDKAELTRILREGSEKANTHAEKTLNRVKDKLGFVIPFSA